MNNVLITGSNGFIGTELCRNLDLHSINYFRLCRSDIEYSNFVSLSNLPKIKTVVHLAGMAHKHVDNSPDVTEVFSKANVDFTLKVAKASYESGATKFIFISSIGVYGLHSSSVPINKNYPLNPTEPYAVSKLQAELQLIQYFSNKNVQLIILRPSLVYGDNPPGNLRKLYNLVCTGLPLPFLYVNNKRSMLHVKSFCKAIQLLLDFEPDSDTVNIYDVSDSASISTFDLVSCFKHKANSKSLLFPVPTFVFKFFLRLLGKEKIFKQLYEDFIVDNHCLSDDIDWIPVTNTLDILKEIRFDK